MIQLAGAAITTSTDNNTILAGLHTYTAGVTLQQFFIFCFVGLTTIFYRRMKRECDEEKIRSVRFLLYTLYASLTLISVSHGETEIFLPRSSPSFATPSLRLTRIPFFQVPSYLPYYRILRQQYEQNQYHNRKP